GTLGQREWHQPSWLAPSPPPTARAAAGGRHRSPRRTSPAPWGRRGNRRGRTGTRGFSAWPPHPHVVALDLGNAATLFTSGSLDPSLRPRLLRRHGQRVRPRLQTAPATEDGATVHAVEHLGTVPTAQERPGREGEQAAGEQGDGGLGKL